MKTRTWIGRATLAAVALILGAGGNPETYMNVGEAMGKAMVELLSAK
jgi:hypothetical protein